MLNQIYALHDLIKSTLGKVDKTHIVGEVSWLPPAKDYVKINVDGSSLGNPRRSGYGGLIRNMLGEWITGFSTNLHAELLAIFHGLNLSWRSGHRMVVCESDSQMALSLITKGVDSFHPYAVVINQIRSLLSLPWNLSFKHSLRVKMNVQIGWLSMELPWTKIMCFGNNVQLN